MKCPKCKKKLQTSRTLDGETFTSREKFCGKCKNIFKTVEYFDSELQKNKDNFLDRITKLTDEKARLENSYLGLRDAIHTIIRAGK